MPDNLIERMDEFVREVMPSHKITHSEKKRRLEELLREAEAAYSGQDLDGRKLLGKRINHFRRILRRFDEEEIATLEGKLSTSTRYLEALKHAPPSGQVSAEIARVGSEIDEMRRRLPQPRGEMGVIAPKLEAPPELEEALRFRETMQQKVLADVDSLRDAITQAQGEIKKLDSCRKSMDADSHELWGRQAQSEIRALGDLIQKWNAQLGHLKKQESLARTYKWQTDKAAELTRRYVASVEAAGAEGKAQTEAVKALREALDELEDILRASQMITATAKTRLQPEILPVEKVGSAIEKFEAILEGLKDKVPEAEVRWAARRLDVAKHELAKMGGATATLRYQTTLESYEKRRSTRGIDYFRANLPQVAKEILSERTIAKLEEDLAARGIGGAQSAITQAIIMAARQNPQRVRAATGG